MTLETLQNNLKKSSKRKIKFIKTCAYDVHGDDKDFVTNVDVVVASLFGGGWLLVVFLGFAKIFCRFFQRFGNSQGLWGLVFLH